MSLTAERAIALKTALYKDAVKHDYVVPGFRIYKRVDGVIHEVPGVGLQCRAMIKTYQERNKLKVDSTFNTETQNHLIPPPPKPVLTAGQKIADRAHEALDLAPRPYNQGRPTAKSLAEFERGSTDCSGLAAICVDAAIPGFATGYGNTWTLIAKGHHVDYGSKLPGDLVFYGPRAGDPTHVTIYVGDGFVVSHGHANGPFYEKIDYRDDRIDIRRYA